MPACESKFVSRSSRKATVAKTVLTIGRPRSCDRMPSLVGDHGPVLRVLGWALTRMRNISLVQRAVYKKAEEGLCVEQSHELFSDIMGRGGASNACFHS